MNQSRPPLLAAPSLQFLADLQVEVGEPQEVGQTARGIRRVIPIVGGTVRGTDWQARVLPGGADFQLLIGDELAELDARYVLETDAGDLVYVTNHALRCGPASVMQRLREGQPVAAESVYFRCAPRFETASPALAWLGTRLFVGSGVRHPQSVAMTFYQLL